MNKEKEFLLWFEQMERGDVAIVGGKSSSLGEMTSKTDVPVPYGFATTAYAYRYFISHRYCSFWFSSLFRRPVWQKKCRKI